MNLLLTLLTSCAGLATPASANPVDGPSETAPEAPDDDGDGYAVPADCDDDDAAVNPDAAEVCANRVDDDCDGLTDAEAEGCAWVGEWDTSSADLALSGGSEASWPALTQWDTLGSMVQVPTGQSITLWDVGGREAVQVASSDDVSGLQGVSFLRVFEDPASGANALAVYRDGYTLGGRVAVGHLGTDGTFAAAGTVTMNPDDSVCTDFGADAVGLVSEEGPRLAVSCTRASWPNPDAPPSFVYVFGPGLTADLGLAEASLTIAGTYPKFGAAVNAADLTGDGVDDLVVGSPDWVTDIGEYYYAAYGRVFVFDGTQTGALTDNDADFSVYPTEYGELGTSSAPLGDVDGDGYEDIAVSERQGAYVMRGPLVADVTLDAAWATYTSENGGSPGSALLSAGDVDGDGAGDLLVGAPFATGAYLVYGVSEGAHDLEEDYALFSGGGFPGSELGAGDLDGDGLSDIVLGHALVGMEGSAVFFGRAR